MRLRPSLRRLLVLIPAFALFALVLTFDGSAFLPGHPGILAEIRFGGSAIMGLLYFVIGALAWLYARQRRPAWLLFGFCTSVALVFAAETASADNVPLFTAFTTAVSALAFADLALLLLALPGTVRIIGRFAGKRYGYRIIATLLAILGCLAAFYAIPFFVFRTTWGGWAVALRPLDYGYYTLLLVGCLFLTFARSGAVRERQQMRFVAFGVITALGPLLLLTVLPELFGLTGVDGQLTSLFFVILPLSLAYSILRYQIMVVETAVRNATLIICIVVGYGVVFYLEPLLWLALPIAYTFRLVGALATAVVLGLSLWRLLRGLVDRWLFPEMIHFDRRMASLAAGTERYGIEELTELIRNEATATFSTDEVCVFTAVEEQGGFAPARPPLAQVRSLLGSLLQSVEPARIQGEEALVFLSERHPLIQRVLRHRSATPFTLPLDQEPAPSEGGPLAKVFRSHDAPPVAVVAPMWHGENLIGLLLIGSHGSYAGLDSTLLEILTNRFAPSLATALLERRGRRQVALLTRLYEIATVGDPTENKRTDLASACAWIVAEATEALAEIWLPDGAGHFHLAAARGTGPTITPRPLLSLQRGDVQPKFYSSHDEEQEAPSWLPERPSVAWAWLPQIGHDQTVLGVLVLAYPRPHVFSQEEQLILTMYSDQWAAKIEHAEIQSRLEAAFARERELERLKADFLSAIYSALLAPLDAVNGYLTLLTEQEAFPLEKGADFLTKVREGCNELVLLDDLMLSAGEIGLKDVSCHLVNVWPIIKGTVENMKAAPPISLPSDPLPLVAFTDSDILRQIVRFGLYQSALVSPGEKIEVTALQRGQTIRVCLRFRSRNRVLTRHEAEPGYLFHAQIFARVGGQITMENEGTQVILAFTLPASEDAFHALLRLHPAAL
jgi:hypothetical protein